MKIKNILILSAVVLVSTAYAENLSKLFQENRELFKQKEVGFIPDFSHAGYYKSEKPLPVVDEKNYKFFDVTKFGAVPNDNKSDRDAVLKAFAAAHKYDGAAVIYFPAGKFNLYEKEDIGKDFLTVKRSNIVIKGDNMATTELFFAEPMHSNSQLLFQAPMPADIKKPLDMNNYGIRGRKLSAITNAPKRGEYVVELKDASKVKAGMWVSINVYLKADSPKTVDYFAPHDIPEGLKKRKVEKYIFETNKVAKVEGNKVYFEMPLQIELRYFSDAILYNYEVISDVGLQDLTMSGNYSELFQHHQCSRFESAYNLTTFSEVVNSFVKNVRYKNYTFAIRVERGGLNTFINILTENNNGHFLSGAYAGSYGNLFMFNREYNFNHHGMIGDGGSNTISYRSIVNGDIEEHCKFSHTSLIDVNYGNFVTRRGGGATHFPMCGRDLVYWNFENTHSGTADYWPEKALWGFRMPPVVVGLHGQKVEFVNADKNVRYIESVGKKVQPESLFDAQLELRLGKLPQWIADETQLFNSISRHSRITMTAPQRNQVFAKNSDIEVKFEFPKELQLKDIKEVVLKASNKSIDAGYKEITKLTKAPFNSCKIKLPAGNWVLQAEMVNSRNEPTLTLPIYISVSDNKPYKELKVEKTAYWEPANSNGFMKLGLHADGKPSLFNALYEKLGMDSAFAKRTKPAALELEVISVIEDSYQKGVELFAKELDKPKNQKIAKMAIDSDLNSSFGGKIWPYSVLLFDFGKSVEVDRMDIVFNREIKIDDRFEVQGSNDAKAWFSPFNDEAKWEFGLYRHGFARGEFEAINSKGKTVTLYFPIRKYRYIRFVTPRLVFPNMTEIKFYGK